MQNKEKRESWEQEVRQRYPSLLSKLPYFETSSGWDKILESMFEEIYRREMFLVETKKIQNEYDQIYIVQVKQKFGGLRVYYNGLNDTGINLIIKNTELLADNTCEFCGSDEGVAKRYIKGWVSTLCNSCKTK